ELEPQLETEQAKPFKATVLVPCDEPKFAPVIVTRTPVEADAGDIDVIVGAGTTVKLTPLLLVLPELTTIFPVVAPEGTKAIMLLVVQLVTVALVPLNVTTLEPWVALKLEPVMVTEAPGAPVVGDKAEIVGAPMTENATPLESPPLV